MRLLGLNEGFTSAQLDQAFRSKALAHHPDRGGEAEVMKRLGQAKATLSQPSRDPSASPSPGNAADASAPESSSEPMDRISFAMVSVVLLIPVAVLMALVVMTLFVLSGAR